MTSSENLASFEHWFRPTFPDAWISEAFSRDTDILTKALQKSLSTPKQTDPVSPFLNPIRPELTPISSSDPESPPKRIPNPTPIPPSAGKISKRKSRTSKRCPTMFINADPSNFRQMVQQVTGIRLGNVNSAVAPVLKPEPHRANRVQGCLPTLDTSAFLLDHHQQVVGPDPNQVGPVNFSPTAVSDGQDMDFGSFPTFPTLESWRPVM